MSSCCEQESEEVANELYLAYMKKMRRLPRLHPQCCNDKCGCYARACLCSDKNSHLKAPLVTA